MDWQDHNKINRLNRNLEESNRLAKARLKEQGYYDTKNKTIHIIQNIIGYGVATGILGYCIHLASKI